MPKSQLSRYRISRNFTLLVALVLTLSIYPFFGDVTVLSWASGGTSY